MLELYLPNMGFFDNIVATADAMYHTGGLSGTLHGYELSLRRDLKERFGHFHNKKNYIILKCTEYIDLL